MKSFIHQLDKAFENRIRLGIMSALMVNDSMDFKGFKDLLEVTDGNLASHSKSLEEKGYIKSRKKFIGRKPNTSYSITPKGKKAFLLHLNALEQMLNQKK